MSNKKVNLSRLGQKIVSNQRDGAQEEQRKDCNGLSVKQRTRRDKMSGLLKVKFPELVKPSLAKGMSSKETPKGCMFTPPKVPDMVVEPVEDPFFFSKRQQSEVSSEAEKARLAVLRTISKMVEENKLIRERLASLKETV